MTTPLALIVGLGNPGAEYARTRHNAGADFVTELARSHGTSLKTESRFRGLVARILVDGNELLLLVPLTFMNRSGEAVGAIANFYKLEPPQILVAHDELDLAPGIVRFKQGGGHGGHNGLRDIVAALGNRADFYRLRIGIGHPGFAERVSPHVLSKPSPGDRQLIDACIDEAVRTLPLAARGEWPLAMNRLNSFKPEG